MGGCSLAKGARSQKCSQRRLRRLLGKLNGGCRQGVRRRLQHGAAMVVWWARWYRAAAKMQGGALLSAQLPWMLVGEQQGVTLPRSPPAFGPAMPMAASDSWCSACRRVTRCTASCRGTGTQLQLNHVSTHGIIRCTRMHAQCHSMMKTMG